MPPCTPMHPCALVPYGCGREASPPACLAAPCRCAGSSTTRTSLRRPSWCGSSPAMLKREAICIGEPHCLAHTTLVHPPRHHGAGSAAQGAKQGGPACLPVHCSSTPLVARRCMSSLLAWCGPTTHLPSRPVRPRQAETCAHVGSVRCCVVE